VTTGRRGLRASARALTDESEVDNRQPMKNRRSAVMRWNVVPQPAITVGVVVGAGVVAFVASGIGNRIPENLVN
jgi:hypothetical protein